MFAITLFLVLEVLEYIKWNYRFDSALVPRVFFALRLLCVSALLMTDGIYFGHPGMSLYFTLLLFYSYYTVPFRLSLACSIIFPLTLFLLSSKGWTGCSHFQTTPSSLWPTGPSS